MIKYNSALSDPLIESIEKKGPVFLIMDEIPVPFYFESVRPKGPEKAVVRFENFLTEPLAAEFVGRTVFYKNSEFESQEQALTYAEVWDEVLLNPAVLMNYSFKGTSADGSPVSGRVSDAFEYPGNPCVELEIEGTCTKVLVPCHPDLLTKIETKHRRLTVVLPQGLL